MVKVQAKKAGEGQTTAAAEAPEKPKAKKREDFEKWEDYCEHKRLQCVSRAEAATKAGEKWERRKAGEHLQLQEKKLARVEKLKSVLAQLQAELAGEAPAAAATA